MATKRNRKPIQAPASYTAHRTRSERTEGPEHEIRYSERSVAWHAPAPYKVQETRTAKVVVEVDFDALISRLVDRALRSRTGRSSLMQGIIVARICGADTGWVEGGKEAA